VEQKQCGTTMDMQQQKDLWHRRGRILAPKRKSSGCGEERNF